MTNIIIYLQFISNLFTNLTAHLDRIKVASFQFEVGNCPSKVGMCRTMSEISDRFPRPGRY